MDSSTLTYIRRNRVLAEAKFRQDVPSDIQVDAHVGKQSFYFQKKLVSPACCLKKQANIINGPLIATLTFAQSVGPGPNPNNFAPDIVVPSERCATIDLGNGKTIYGNQFIDGFWDYGHGTTVKIYSRCTVNKLVLGFNEGGAGTT